VQEDMENNQQRQQTSTLLKYFSITIQNQQRQQTSTDNITTHSRAIQTSKQCSYTKPAETTNQQIQQNQQSLPSSRDYKPA
jgi:hypothetical protein